MDVSPGRFLLHYRILEKLGAGGMGEVFLAEDTKLARQVALKLLPPAMASDPRRLKRFRSEARALAALDHPNIVTVYAVEETDGVHFLTMGLVAGPRVGELIDGGGLPLDRLLRIAVPLADALATAHDRGITHRDVKPANVMLTEGGEVKLLDFGLVKFDNDAPTHHLETTTLMETGEGVLVGTAPYMSPEQVKGRPIDHRSDIFSLGVLLYEMATGRRPFAGDAPASVVSSILRDTPEPIESVRADLPSELDRIVHRCIEKDPERRFQTAKDVRNELEILERGLHSSAPARTVLQRPRWWVPVGILALVAAVTGWAVLRDRADPVTFGRSGTATVAAATDVRRLVVLPFENLGDAEDELFAAGMTEELTSRLAAVANLAVISRKSARH